MSLSTLLEAAKYLDYLDSSNQQQLQNNPLHHHQQRRQQHQQQQHQQQQQQQFTWQQQPQQSHKSNKQSQKSSATSSRRRAGKKANILMPPMSLPTNYSAVQVQGVPIPLVSSNNQADASSLSSSLTTGSPLSSTNGFPSAALLCSNTSSTASSLSSSTSSSCGDIVMRDNDFNCPSGSSTASGGKARSHKYNLTHQANDLGLNLEATINESNNDSTATNHQQHPCVAASVASSQLMAMSSAQSSQAIQAIGSGHLIRTPSGAILTANGTKIEQMQFPFPGVQQQHLDGVNGSGLNGLMGQYGGGGGDLAGSPNTRAQILMTRVPVILNSLSPTTQSGISYQNMSSSPTSVSSSYSRHRELHKTLEKNRRAHLRHCFELLKAELPASEYVDKKTSHINIIKSAIKYVMILRQQESELETELQRLARIKHQLTENMSSLRGRQPQPLQPQIQQQKQTQKPTSDQLPQELAKQSDEHAIVTGIVVKNDEDVVDNQASLDLSSTDSNLEASPEPAEAAATDNELRKNVNNGEQLVADHGVAIVVEDEAIDKSAKESLSLVADAAALQTPTPTQTPIPAVVDAIASPTQATGNPDSPGSDDPQSSVETKMLLNCLADKLSLK